MYIRNSWYVAAEPHEVRAGAVLGRTLLGERVVLYRTDGGRMVAMADHCPHRYAPLSRGRVEGDCLRCPYHGAVYDPAGKCVAVPGQTGEFGQASGVRTYPVLERYSYVWIWMGDPALADPALLPEFFAPADHPDWRGRHDRFLSLPVYYELVNDNLHDVSHTKFVHPETLGADLNVRVVRLARGEAHEGIFMERDVTDRTIRTRLHIEDFQGGPTFHRMVAYGRGLAAWTDNITWDLTVTYCAPSFFSFHPRSKPVGAGDDEVVEFASLNAITPETEGSCHYFFYTANNLVASPQRRAEYTELIADSILFAFRQDEALLIEQMQRVPDGGVNSDTLMETSFMGDMLQIAGRKIIRRLIAAEQSEANQSDAAA